MKIIHAHISFVRAKQRLLEKQEKWQEAVQCWDEGIAKLKRAPFFQAKKQKHYKIQENGKKLLNVGIKKSIKTRIIEFFMFGKALKIKVFLRIFFSKGKYKSLHLQFKIFLYFQIQQSFILLTQNRSNIIQILSFFINLQQFQLYFWDSNHY
ncbi:unnamed protein product [Paramecium pentaurelia]|uniref:Uncharacterized protein n=1 Tax=Paramecium pentaurelia TaxID=43138 RepID=A0A8S1YBX9_9CILI|nr:unnamed protein product [Paramecium pentaurelia]